MGQVDTTYIASGLTAVSRTNEPVKVSNEQALAAIDKATSARVATKEIVETTAAVAEAISRINAEFEQSDVALRFVMDDVIQRPVVSVIDQESGELLRQLPSEEVLRAARNIESMKGILYSGEG